MKNKRNFLLLVTLVTVMLFSTSCGNPREISGYYETDNLGLTFSGFEFSDDGKVVYYCGGYKNAYGTYEANGSGYKLTIDKFDLDSHFTGTVKGIKEDCYIKVKPKDDEKIEVEIKSKDSRYIIAGEIDNEEYHKVEQK